jgi:hypothetical protein
MIEQITPVWFALAAGWGVLGGLVGAVLAGTLGAAWAGSREGERAAVERMIAAADHAWRHRHLGRPYENYSA